MCSGVSRTDPAATTHRLSLAVDQQPGSGQQHLERSPLSYDFAQAWSLHVELVFYLLLPAVFAAAALFVRHNRMAWLLGGLATTWVSVDI